MLQKVIMQSAHLKIAMLGVFLMISGFNALAQQRVDKAVGFGAHYGYHSMSGRQGLSFAVMLKEKTMLYGSAGYEAYRGASINAGYERLFTLYKWKPMGGVTVGFFTGNETRMGVEDVDLTIYKTEAHGYALLHTGVTRMFMVDYYYRTIVFCVSPFVSYMINLASPKLSSSGHEDAGRDRIMNRGVRGGPGIGLRFTFLIQEF